MASKYVSVQCTCVSGMRTSVLLVTELERVVLA